MTREEASSRRAVDVVECPFEDFADLQALSPSYLSKEIDVQIRRECVDGEMGDRLE